MSEIKENVSISTGNSANANTKRYQQDHVTTQCFMRPVPVFAREKKGTSNFKVFHEDFCRCDPMPVPTFGRAMIYDRAFFVPFRTIYKDWNEFIATSPAYTAVETINLPSNVPTIRNDQLCQLLIMNSTAITTGTPDFVYYDSNTNTSTMYVFNMQGSFIFKVLCSLGYMVNFRDDDRFEASLLPLYAYMKVILDWYYPSQYAYNLYFKRVEYYFSNVDASSNPMPVSVINEFFTYLCYCSYDADYFTSAWDNPVGPNSANFERRVQIKDVTNNSGKELVVTNYQAGAASPASTHKPSNLTPYVGGTDNTSTTTSDGVMTMYVSEALRALTDYTKRHALAGVRAVDRYLAEFGISLSSEILKRSIYLGYNSYPLQFGDVMSHSDTSSSGGDRLGDYAGKGIGYGHYTFGYDDKNEFGMFLIINSIVPKVGMFEGQVRDTMHVSCLDFWHGDYDHLGVQAIARREAGCMMDGTSQSSAVARLNDGVFGYFPRYGEYAVGFDRVSGLYRENSRNLGLSSYYLMRQIPWSATLDSLTHDVDMALATDFLNYNRIFYDASKDSWDFFNMVHHFEVEFEDESRPLWEQYDFENNYKRIKENIGGSTVN